MEQINGSAFSSVEEEKILILILFKGGDEKKSELLKKDQSRILKIGLLWFIWPFVSEN